MKKRPIFSMIFFLLLVFILVIGCSGSKGLRTVEGDPGILYKQGLVLFNKGDYAEALTKFEEEAAYLSVLDWKVEFFWEAAN